MQSNAEDGYCPPQGAIQDEYCPLQDDYSFNPFYSDMTEQCSLPQGREPVQAQVSENSQPAQSQKFHPSHSRSLSDPRAAMAGVEAAPQHPGSSQMVTPKMAYRSHQRSPSDPSFTVKRAGDVDNQATGQLVSFDSLDETKENWNPFSPFYDGKGDAVALSGDVDDGDDDFASLRSDNGSSLQGSSVNEVGGRRAIDEVAPGAAKDLFGAAVFTTVQQEQERHANLATASQEILPDSSQLPQDFQLHVHVALYGGLSNDSDGGTHAPQSPDPFGSVPFGSKGAPPQPPPPTSPDIFGQAPFEVLKSDRRQRKKQEPSSGVIPDHHSSEHSDMFGLQPFAAGSHSGSQPQLPHNVSPSAIGHSKSDTELFASKPFGSNEVVDEFGATSFSGTVEEVCVRDKGADGDSGQVNPAAVFHEQDDPFSGVPFNPTISSSTKADKLARRNARWGQHASQGPHPVPGQHLPQGPHTVSGQTGAPRTRRQLPQIPTNRTAVTAGQRSPVQGIRVFPVKPAGGSPRLAQKQQQKPSSNRVINAAR